MYILKQSKTSVPARGFTLVELLVYIAVMTLALASIVILLVNATKVLTRVKEIKEVRTSALVSLDRIGREIKNAEAITVAGSTLGTNPGSLKLVSTDPVGTPREVIIELDENNDLVLYYNGVSRGSLISEKVSVNDLEFYRVDNTLSESVRVKLTLSHEAAPTRSETFYTTALVRGSY